jgi:hypothetical protein
MKNPININMKRITLFLMLSAFFSLTIFAKEKTEKVLVDKQFEVNKNALLQIDHKYGTVECKNWDKEAISVKVIASVNASSAEKAEQVFDAITIHLDGNSSGVSVESEFSNKLFDKGNNELSIDFEIFMPASVRLELDHQFGNAYVEAVEGDAVISSEYGSLEIEELKGESNSIEIGFGNANIGYLKAGDIEVEYSSIELGKSETLSIESDYSELSIDKVGTLEIENEGGNVEIGKVEKLSLSSKFSDFKVGELSTNLDGETEYGSLTVKKVRAGFSNIIIENSFGSVSLYFEPECSFEIIAELEFCSLNYPDELAEFSKRIVSNSSDSYYEGTIGSGPKTGSKVELSSEYGGFSIFFR